MLKVNFRVLTSTQLVMITAWENLRQRTMPNDRASDTLDTIVRTDKALPSLIVILI